MVVVVVVACIRNSKNAYFFLVDQILSGTPFQLVQNFIGFELNRIK